MKLSNSFWVRPYRPNAFLLWLLALFLGYALVVSAYWVSSAQAQHKLERVTPKYLASLETVRKYQAIAAQRSLTSAELDDLNALPFDSGKMLEPDGIPIKSVDEPRSSPSSDPSFDEILAEKLRQSASAQTALARFMFESNLPTNALFAAFALLGISLLVPFLRILTLGAVFRPREVAIANNHPLFAPMMAELFVWVIVSLAGASLIAANIFRPVGELIRSLTVTTEGLSPQASSMFQYLSSGLPVSYVLFAQTSPFPSAEAVSVVVGACVGVATVVLALKAGSRSMSVLVVPAAFLVLAFFNPNQPEAGSGVTAPIYQLFSSIQVTQPSLHCLLAAAAAVFFFVAGLLSGLRIATYAGYGGLIMATAWTTLSSISIGEASVQAFLLLTAISFATVVLVELCVKRLVMRHAFDPD